MKNSVEGIRGAFNKNAYSDENHREVMRQMTAQNGPSGYKIGELPIFLSKSLVDQMAEGGKEIIQQAMDPKLLPILDKYVPASYRISNAPDHPAFVLVDFAITEDKDGKLVPRLIEFQAFTAHFAWLADAAEAYKDVYNLGDEFRYAISAKDRAGYDEQIRKAIVGPHKPENVALVEIDPWNQDTRMDFIATQNLLRIKVLDVTEIIKMGNKLYYIGDDGNAVQIDRIYNRMVPDELESRGIAEKMNFKFTDKLDVEWLADPVWVFRMSKAAVPYIDHELAPKAKLLSQIDKLPEDLGNYVLKPLFFHGGQGVKVDITKADIDAIPQSEKHGWMLMEKVTYARFMDTPDPALKTGAEVRVLYTWDENGLKPAIMMGRATSAKLANLAYNKGKYLGLSPVLFVDAPEKADPLPPVTSVAYAAKSVAFN